VARPCKQGSGRARSTRGAAIKIPLKAPRSSIKIDAHGQSSYLDAVVEPEEMVAQTASEDPEVGLRGVASLRALLEAVEELQVRRARAFGWSWRQIAELLGVSKQAVHQKYGKGERRPPRRLR
jgi:DNA-directed RNA polymerase specialized sigma24 family protein